ncbi:MAG TPA: TIGR02444 family protein [Stellaceae bacterium]|nr:TIGR02444 family protein [Stellaceae bacterium]
MAESGDEFWNFSLAFYGRPGVSAACLALQDRHGLDVNLVLYACWVGLSGRGQLTAADIARAAAVNAPWREAVIEKLRAARRAIKEAAPEATGLYASAKAIELDAERIAQQRLAACAPGVTTNAVARRADATANLTLYLENEAARGAAPAIFAAIAAWA